MSLSPSLALMLGSMLTRLQAEESIAMTNAVALGSGQMKQADARRASRRMEAAARGSSRSGAEQLSRDPREMMNQLALKGWKVVERGADGSIVREIQPGSVEE